jgi:hypothetical protein
MYHYNLTSDEMFIQCFNNNSNNLLCIFKVNKEAIAWVESQLKKNPSLTVPQILELAKVYGYEITKKEIMMIRFNYIKAHSLKNKEEWVKTNIILKHNQYTNFN